MSNIIHYATFMTNEEMTVEEILNYNKFTYSFSVNF